MLHKKAKEADKLTVLRALKSAISYATIAYSRIASKIASTFFFASPNNM